jgi:DNA mismatch repair protein MSH4
MLQVGLNRLLDVARETYRENVEDTHQLCQDLSEQCDLPLQLSYSDSGGYSFTLKKTDIPRELPRRFINVVSKGDRWVFSTVELVSHILFVQCHFQPFHQRKKNARTKDALDETLILSDK